MKGSERDDLDPVLEASFEGWYQRHAKRTLRDIETVFGATLDSNVAGVAMVKKIDPKTGYVYYIAVLPQYRGKKIGGQLLDRSLEYFFEQGINTVFASLIQEHDEPKLLFKSRGFRETNFSEISKKYGNLHAINMYRKMLVVSGEVVVVKELTKPLN